jgi:hypothetical protein
VTDQRPFEDVEMLADGFSIPELKWRELVFTGALRQEADGTWTRDPSRPMTPFRQGDLFPDGQHFEVARAGGRARIRRRVATART